MKRWVALKLLGWAYQLEPMIAVATRNAVILQLAAEHQAQQEAEQQAAAQWLAARRERAARAARDQ